jgi:hypothetical protein
MRYCCLIRTAVHYRHQAFHAGLRAIGAKESGPADCDLLVIWNRYGQFASHADACEKRGGVVLVAENAYLGNELAGDRWYAISRNQHNGAGTWPDGGPERWDALSYPLAPFREDGREIVVLPQRGIGPLGVAMPAAWTREVVRRLPALTRRPVRVRDHPGTRTDMPTLEEDLREAWAVVVWGSGAGIKALAMGIPVFYAFAHWIGAPGARDIAQFKLGPLRDDAARLAMFRRLAWAQWRLSEIEDGSAFRHLLKKLWPT